MKIAVVGMVVIQLMGSVVHSQVHIRENVTISPMKAYDAQMIFPTGILLLCRSTITVTIQHGYDNLTDPNTNIDLVLTSPVSATISTDALHSFKVPWTSPELNAGSVLRFAIIEHHSCTGIVDTVEVATFPGQQSSPLSSTFSFTVSGWGSRCSAAGEASWSELFFDVTVNRTIADIVVDGDGLVHFGLCWWKDDGEPEPAPVRLEIKGPCPALLDTVIYAAGGAVSGELEGSIAGTYTFSPAISSEASGNLRAVYYIGGDLKGGKWMFGNGSKGIADPAQEWCPLVTGRDIPFSTPFSSGFNLSLYPSSIPTLHRGDYAAAWLDEVYDCSGSRWFPSEPITLTILSGNEYASLYVTNWTTGNEEKLGSTVTTTAKKINSWEDSPYLVVDSEIPDAGGWVVLQAESGGMTSRDSVAVSPPPVVVTVIPPEISPGDTAAILVKERYTDGTTGDFPQDQDFEVQIFGGEKYGDIVAPDSTGDYFKPIKQGFKFVAADSIDSSVVTVGIKVEQAVGGATSTAPIGMVKGKENVSDARYGRDLSGRSRSRSIKTTSAHRNGKSVSFIEGMYGIGWVKIMKEEERTILLGETKYYYVVDDPDHADKLIIKESPTPVNGKTDVVFADPTTQEGDKLGVYWEYRDEQGNDLRKSMPGSIRLLGRY